MNNDDTIRCAVCDSTYSSEQSIMGCVDSHMKHHVCGDCYANLPNGKRCPLCRGTQFSRNQVLEKCLPQTIAKCNLCAQSVPYSDLKDHEETCPHRPVLTKTNPDGSRSKGQWNGKEQLHGIGEITFADGVVIKGEFKDGYGNGHGKITDANGDVFEGEFNDGYKNGHGKWTFADGDIFEGEYKDGKKNGLFTCFNKSETHLGLHWFVDGKLTRRILSKITDIYNTPPQDPQQTKPNATLQSNTDSKKRKYRDISGSTGSGSGTSATNR